MPGGELGGCYNEAMEGVLFIGLIMVVAGLVAVAGILLLRALFWGEKDAAKDAKTEQTWRPPFVQGEALQAWAAKTAQAEVQHRLAGPWTGHSMVRLAKDVAREATHAMLPLATQAELERIVPCPAEGQGVFGVTAPEVLAIAANLRQIRSRGDQHRIAEMAAANAKKLATPAPAGGSPPVLPCPLQGENQVCCTYSARPLHCLPLHAKTVAGTGDPTFESSVGQGVQAGLQAGLKSAGFDAEVYEFNSALARALDIPDAAERWAKGENIFASCHRAGDATA